MPYPNEHSARLKNPGDFNPDTFRRKNDGTIYGKIKVPQTAAVIWGKLKGRDNPADQPVPQALRFPVKYWTEEKARKWLKDNNVKYIRFEPAKKNQEKKDQADADNRQHIFSLISKLQTKIWAMEPRALQVLFETMDSKESWLPEYVKINRPGPKLRIEANTAVIDIRGVLINDIPEAFLFWGIEATSYRAIRGLMQEAVADENVTNIMLKVNSPGGVADSGLIETADLIRAAREAKTVTAVIEDLGASAAYWLASQADVISIEANSETGSIGVYTVYVDSSKKYEDMGYKVHVIKSGKYKAMGVPGAEITEEQVSAVQEIIDGIADNFVKAVAAGRKKDIKQIQELANGRMWLASKAVKLGLADKVIRSNYAQLINQKKGKSMDSENEKVDSQVEINEAVEKAQAAEQKRITGIKAAFEDESEFALKAIEAGWDVQKAKAEFCDVLKARAAEKAKAAAAAEQKEGGSAPIKTEGSDGGGDSNFIAQARQMVEDGKAKSMTEAMKKLRRRDPELHERFKAHSEEMGRAVYEEVA